MAQTVVLSEMRYKKKWAALNDELNRIAETTSFGGRKLLNGSFSSSSFQIGASSGEAVQVSLKNMRSDSLDMGGFSYIAAGKADSSAGKCAQGSQPAHHAIHQCSRSARDHQY